MKKHLVLISLLVALALLAGCTQSANKADSQEKDPSQEINAPNDDTEQVDATTDSAGTTVVDNKVIKIGILQLMAHESLDSACTGFLDRLAETGYRDGENISVIMQNAFGEQANLKSMAEKLLRECDLVLAITTPAAQTVVGLSPSIPVLFTAVTDPIDAGLVETLEQPGREVTGTSDQAPVDRQIDLLLSLKEMSHIGLIYNAAEPNSVLQAAEAEAQIEKAGKKVVAVTVASTNDVQQAMTTLVTKVDGIYIPTDNTMASTAAASGMIAQEAGIPIVAGSIDQTAVGGTATIGISYYDLGRQTADQALKILTGEKKASEIAVGFADNLELFVNQEYAVAIGIDPDSITIP
ncbi:MAG: ABC transporter substrate-binding protein [Saccharofermentanales bacterium]|jgi:putative ABC transport system substrate-binding protein|nr:ABC transporter substrate-binding protein [Bacillota bacterium]NLB08585.1 ABC transporter substrate-binding protein [Clostridiales bacterium]